MARHQASYLVIGHPSCGKTILPATWGAKRGSIHQAKGAVYMTSMGFWFWVRMRQTHIWYDMTIEDVTVDNAPRASPTISAPQALVSRVVACLLWPLNQQSGQGQTDTVVWFQHIRYIPTTSLLLLLSSGSPTMEASIDFHIFPFTSVLDVIMQEWFYKAAAEQLKSRLVSGDLTSWSLRWKSKKQTYVLWKDICKQVGASSIFIQLAVLAVNAIPIE